MFWNSLFSDTGGISYSFYLDEIGVELSENTWWTLLLRVLFQGIALYAWGFAPFYRLQ
jgi:hypothetical protein